MTTNLTTREKKPLNYRTPHRKYYNKISYTRAHRLESEIGYETYDNICII